MSAIEDLRKVLQDFLAPELRALTTRLDAIDQRFEDMSTVMNTRFDSLSKEIGQVRELLDIDSGLSRLESKQSTVAQ
jgi:hypothetical protein